MAREPIGRRHEAQLRLCHDVVQAEPLVNVGRREPAMTWCELRPVYGWCWDCGYYTCHVHRNSVHELHEVTTLAEETRKGRLRA